MTWEGSGHYCIYSLIIFRCRIRNLSIFIQREPLVSEECGRRAFLSLVTVSYQVQPQIHQMIKQSWLATWFAFYQDNWKRFIKFLEKMFSLFAGGSLGAMNGLYRYRKELLLRAAEGMSSPCKILWNEMLQIRLTVYISIFIYFGFWKMGVNLKLFHNSFSHFSQFEKFVIANNTRYNLCVMYFFLLMLYLLQKIENQIFLKITYCTV